MRDPDEGLTATGTITTGVDRRRVPAAFEPVLAEARRLTGPEVSLYVYGSVATGRARVGPSDVDLVTLGLAPTRAKELSPILSDRFATLAREVALSPMTPDDLREDDAGHGNRAFLRHYCAWVSGPDPARDLQDIPGDRDAARGFNGDVATKAEAWRASLSSVDPDDEPGRRALARRIGRKSLFAASGLVSVHDATWTTDRAWAAERWGQVHPSLADDLELLLAWGDGTATAPTRDQLGRMLRGGVAELVDQFRERIGLWR